MIRLPRRDESGAVAVLFGILSLVLFLIAAMVVDFGLARDVRRQAQNAADSAALAAGNVIYAEPANGGCATVPCFDEAVAAAKTFAQQNYGVDPSEWATCTDPDKLPYRPAGNTECISFDLSIKPTQVRVRIPNRTAEFNMSGGATGVEQVTIAAQARAKIELDLPMPCGLCVLGSGFLHDLQNGDVYVNGNNVHFNGDVSVSNNGVIVTNGEINVEGTAYGANSSYQPDPNENMDPIKDPLAHLVLPPDMSTLTNKINPCVSGPGIYDGFDLRGMTCTLSPGLYVIKSGVWDMSGNTSTLLQGTGVTLYFTCSTGTAVRECNVGEAGATLDSSGNGELNIKAPTSGPLQGVAIAYDRNNTSTLRLTGNGSGGMTGAIYLASGKVQLNGNGCASTYNTLMVVKNIEMNGNPACMKLNYDPNQNPRQAPTNLHLDN